MTPEQIEARMREQRSVWVDLPESLGTGLAVRVERPAEAEFGEFLRPAGGDRANWSCNLDQVKRVVTGWRGFTEATFIESGASDEVPFSRGLWATWVADHIAAARPVADKVVSMLAAHEVSTAETEKN
jgi:hypothetical protein